MEFNDLISKRRSNRNYTKKKVTQTQLKELYEALQTAPSGSNKQDFKFIFVTDNDIRNKLATKAGKQEFIQQAPVIMVATCKKGYEFNVAIAVDHMILAATNIGMGTCWIGWFDKAVAKDILEIPEDISVPIMVTIGYPGDNPEARKRKSIEELICNNKYVE